MTWMTEAPGKILPLVLAMAMAAAAVGAEDDVAQRRLDDYFAAMGGRDVWAAGRGEYVLASISDPRFPLPGTFELCWNWEQPQTADRARFQGTTQIRAFDGRQGWTATRSSVSTGTVLADWDAARRERGFAEWRGNFEILTHRLARGDRRVSARMGDGPWSGWIEIEVDGLTVAQLLLDDRGAPKRFHRVFDDVNVRFGPLADRGQLKFPAWGAFDDGEPFDLIAFEILDAPPRNVQQPPADEHRGFWVCG